MGGEGVRCGGAGDEARVSGELVGGTDKETNRTRLTRIQGILIAVQKVG